MDRILILNASPRAPRSNSKRYAQLFAAHCPPTEILAVTKDNHESLAARMESVHDVLLVFPLYADAIPVTLLNFLKTLEAHPPAHKPTISVLINCGFLEPHQNDVAVEMVSFFCRKNGYPFGSVLKIGGGEAILDSPFKILAARKIRQLARSITRQQHQTLCVSMPLTKRMFLAASTRYWIQYGKKNGISEAQMRTMEIEGSTGAVSSEC